MSMLISGLGELRDWYVGEYFLLGEMHTDIGNSQIENHVYIFVNCSQMFQKERERVGVKEQEQKEQIQQNGEYQCGVCDSPFYCTCSYSKN